MVICAGSGGVGKTTTAAAVALGLAEQGLKVAVVTIDPARRLANALGLRELDNEPRRVEIEAPGELWAMMLDAKRTFDQLIEHLAPDEKTRDEVSPTGSTSSSRAPWRGRRSSPRSPSSTSSTATATTTCSSSTRRRRATPWTSSTPR